MAFKTKLDLSNNRQVKQEVKTTLELSGATSFGVPFSALTTGPDLTSVVVLTGLTPSSVTLFTGTTGSTIFTWANSNMVLGSNGLVAITPSNSGVTQSTTGFTGVTATTIDGNTLFLTYTGVSYDLTVNTLISLGGGVYSGNASTSQLQYLLANALDFSGRTIWVDVNGITRTQSLIVTSGITQNGVSSINKVLNIGLLNLSSATGATVAHSLGSKFTGITSVNATILDDNQTLVTGFLSQSGNSFTVDAVNVSLLKNSTYYNNANYDGTSFNRGYITLTYTP